MTHDLTHLIYITHIIYITTHMVKLIFYVYRKTDIFFFSRYENFNRILSKKTKKNFQKRLMKVTKIFLKKKKARTANMLVSDIEIILTKKKKRSVNGSERYKKLLEDENKG